MFPNDYKQSRQNVLKSLPSPQKISSRTKNPNKNNSPIIGFIPRSLPQSSPIVFHISLIPPFFVTYVSHSEKNINETRWVSMSHRASIFNAISSDPTLPINIYRNAVFVCFAYLPGCQNYDKTSLASPRTFLERSKTVYTLMHIYIFEALLIDQQYRNDIVVELTHDTG